MVGRSGMSAQGGWIKSWRHLLELACRTASATGVERRNHVSFNGAAVDDSRKSCLRSYIYVLRGSIPIHVAREKRRKKDDSHTQIG